MFNAGQDFYQVLYDQIAVWGTEYLDLAIRVVYVLEQRTIKESIEKNTTYEGLKMFDIFAYKYYQELESFFTARNSSMLILLQSSDFNSRKDHFP